MITKELIKKEIDKLPDDLLQAVYAFIKKLSLVKKDKSINLTPRNFGGAFDNKNARDEAYD